MESVNAVRRLAAVDTICLSPVLHPLVLFSIVRILNRQMAASCVRLFPRQLLHYSL